MKPTKESMRRAASAAGWVCAAVMLLTSYSFSLYFILSSGWLQGPRASSADTTKAVLAFLATGASAAVTLVGGMLVAEHNRRSRKLTKLQMSQSEKHNKSTRAQTELDTTIKGLSLLTADGELAAQPVISGALATIVDLGHPLIAMRALDSLWDTKSIHPATACWLIGEVFQRDKLKREAIEAAALLREHAIDLVGPSEGRCKLYWPQSLLEGWRPTLPLRARRDIFFATVELVLSRRRRWWDIHESLSWLVAMLYDALETETNRELRLSIASVMLPLADVFDAEHQLHHFRRETEVSVEDVRSLAIHVSSGAEDRQALPPHVTKLGSDIESWLRDRHTGFRSFGCEHHRRRVPTQARARRGAGSEVQTSFLVKR